MNAGPLKPTPSPTRHQMRTPLARVRGLGSAKEGADHFWKLRVTAFANIFLVLFVLGLMVSIAGADYIVVKKALQKPLIAILMLLLVLSGVHHMRLGMQSIIEDYVHTEGRKVLYLMLNSFFSIAIALSCIYAIMKLSFAP